MAACLVSCESSREVSRPSCFLTLHDLDLRGQEDGLAAYGWGAACHIVTVMHSHSLWTCFCPLPGRSGLAALLVSLPSIWCRLRLSPLRSDEQRRGGVEQMAM